MRVNTDALAASLATAVLVAGLALGSRAASGGDSYGYVSQAALWRQGSVVQPVPLMQSAAWPNAPDTLAPLGYRPAQRAFAIVPTYAPGLPILMAGASVLAGACAVYFVVPVCAGLLVWLTYRLGLRTGDRGVAAGAAALVATSPTLLFMTMWPMSDVPVSTFWTAGILSAASGGGRGRDVLTGVLTGLAILIRPNLVLLAVVPAGLVLQRAYRENRARAWQSALAFAGGVTPFVAGVAVLNAFLYGSPLESGYGGLNRLYAVERIPTNMLRHIRWVYESQGPYPFLFAAGLVAALRARQHSVLTWGALLAVLVWISYLPYHAYGEWWYLRFLLPAFPILSVLAVYGVSAMFARFGERMRTAITGAFVVAAAAHAITFVVNREIAGLGEGEQRAVEVGLFANDLPPNAILVSGQHSGSLRYYSGRTTLRYDRLDPQWLDRTLDMLRAENLQPYAVLEAWEEPLFRAHFAGQASLARLAEPPFAALDSNVAVRVYDLAPEHPRGETKAISHIPRSQCREP